MAIKTKTIHVELFGGEQDGYTADIETEGRWPNMFFVHRACDNQRISEARDPQLKRLLNDSLAILAYEFSKADPRDGVKGGKVYRYDRCEARDRALSDPAV
jgi:hypothetical protein